MKIENIDEEPKEVYFNCLGECPVNVPLCIQSVSKPNEYTKPDDIVIVLQNAIGKRYVLVKAKDSESEMVLHEPGYQITFNAINPKNFVIRF